MLCHATSCYVMLCHAMSVNHQQVRWVTFLGDTPYSSHTWRCNMGTPAIPSDASSRLALHKPGPRRQCMNVAILHLYNICLISRYTSWSPICFPLCPFCLRKPDFSGNTIAVVSCNVSLSSSQLIYFGVWILDHLPAKRPRNTAWAQCGADPAWEAKIWRLKLRRQPESDGNSWHKWGLHPKKKRHSSFHRQFWLSKKQRCGFSSGSPK